LMVQGQFEDESANSLARVTVPVTMVVNLMPLVCQRLLEGGLGAVIHVLRLELIFVGYALLCHFDFMVGTFTFKACVGMVILCLPHASLFFSFGNRNMVYSHLTSHETGAAEYVNTGRPLPFESTAIHQLYCRFAISHYEPAMYLSSIAALTQLLSREEVTALRLGIFVVQLLLWILAPVIFTPNLRSYNPSSLFRFLVPNRADIMLVAAGDDRILDAKGKPVKPQAKPEVDKPQVDLSFMDWAVVECNTAFEDTGFGLKLLKLVLSGCFALVLWLTVPALIKAHLVYFTLAWAMYVLCTTVVFGNVLGSRSMLQIWQIIGVPSCWYFILRSCEVEFMTFWDEVTRTLWTGFLQVSIVGVLHHVALVVLHLNFAGDGHASRTMRRLRWLQYLDWIFLAEPVRWATAALVLLIQLAVITLCRLLDQDGWHAWYLFNFRREHTTEPTLLPADKRGGRESWKFITKKRTTPPPDEAQKQTSPPRSPRHVRSTNTRPHVSPPRRRPLYS